MILLSVHLLTFNSEKYIEETLISILKQKVDFDYEIVIGDDCSTDKTLEIVNRYALKHPDLFKVKQNKVQLGILKNFKTTLDRCLGKYVFDIAGDDLLKSDTSLQKMVNVFNDNPELGFIDCGIDRLNDKNGKTEALLNKELLHAPDKDYVKAALLGSIVPIGICYNRELLYKYVDFKTYMDMKITIEDYPIIVNMIMHTKFLRIHESLVIYRVHDSSYSHKKTFERHFFLNNQMRLLFKYFSNKYEFSKDIIEAFYINSNRELLFFAGYFEKKELGKDMFRKLKSTRVKDLVHYWASQSKMFRKLVSIKRFIS